MAMTSAHAEHELKRLKALRRLQLLDTAPSASFDRITRLTATALNVPIVLISLIDESRQWFKSHFGLDVTETPRDVSYCSYAVSDGEPLIVPDATRDPRFSSNPLVTGEPQIRFYAGIPLFTHGGLAVGTLCAIDRRPRQLLYEALEVLEDFASIAEDLIDGRESLIRRRECVDYAAERDRLLQDTVEAVPLGIVRTSASGKIRQANAWARHLLGSGTPTLVGRSVSDIIQPEDWWAHGADIERVMDGTLKSHTARLRLMRADGMSAPVHVSFTLKQLASGKPGYVLMLLDDRR
jgi:PAS domain S-box-containing protein